MLAPPLLYGAIQRLLGKRQCLLENRGHQDWSSCSADLRSTWSSQAEKEKAEEKVLLTQPLLVHPSSSEMPEQGSSSRSTDFHSTWSSEEKVFLKHPVTSCEMSCQEGTSSNVPFSSGDTCSEGTAKRKAIVGKGIKLQRWLSKLCRRLKFSPGGYHMVFKYISNA